MPGAVAPRSPSARVALVHPAASPTPSSPSGLDVVRIVVASATIECCTPPPVVGQPVAWHLTFVRATPEDMTVIDEEADWHLVASASSGFVIHRGGDAADWFAGNGPPPAPGPVRLHGHLCAVAHGPVPHGHPRVAGVVQRVWVISQDEELREGGRVSWILPVSGTTVLTEVSAAPPRFRMVVPARGQRRRNEVGVLVELSVSGEPGSALTLLPVV